MTNKALCLITACGAALGLTGTATAQLTPGQPYLVNGSGATLLENFAKAPALTNDFIDVDGDGLVGIDADQLAPADIFAPFLPFQDESLIVSYRVSGSVRGFRELVQFGIPGVFAQGDPDELVNPGGFAATLNLLIDNSIQNRIAIVTDENVVGPNGIAANPGGYRVLSNAAGPDSFRAATSGGGIHMDFANLDVPVAYAVRDEATIPAKFNSVPGEIGYGNNPVVGINKDGSAADPFLATNLLESLAGPNGTANTNIASPSANTIFDTTISLVPVATIANPGTDLERLDMSYVQYLKVTGRGTDGTNYVVCTRDIGSGTRNAFANGHGIDPSFCVGDNIGERSAASSDDLLGPNYQPTNRGGSSRVEGSTMNHRLAIGHTGAERGDTGWLNSPNAASNPSNRLLNSLPIRADVKGGTVYAGPTLANVIAGGPNGWNVTAAASIATFGDPRSNAAHLGGWGFLPDGLDGISGNADDETGLYPFPSAPVANPAAAAFVNNLTRAIDAFQELPGDDETLFTPGELAATLYVLPAAADMVPNPNPNPATGYIDQVPNPAQNLSLKNFLLSPGFPNALKNTRLESADPLATGRVPVRTTNVAYTDATETGGSANGGYYITQGGTAVSYGGNLSPRNKVFFDFDGNGIREMGDVAHAYLALLDREAGAGVQWVAPAGNGLLATEHPGAVPGSDAIIEVLGDANGDGNFDREDMRYFADGLAIDSSSGNLNRFMGFEALDNEEANFFGIAAYTTGASYKAGDAAADVAGDLPTKGFIPNGFDGVINNADVDYVAANFGDWSMLDIDNAMSMDLSADMNGDLVVDLNDVCFVIETVLGTSFGDLNLDGVRDASDAALVNVGGVATYSNGDVNLDGVIDAVDQAIAGGSQIYGCSTIVCAGDIADDFGFLGGDGMVSFGDFLALLGLIGPCPGGTPGCTGDIADDFGFLGGDGMVSFGDFLALLGLIGPCP